VVTLLSKGNTKADLAEVSGIICVDDATWEKWQEVSKKWLDAACQKGPFWEKTTIRTSILSVRPRTTPSVRIYPVDPQLLADGFLRIRADKNLSERTLPVCADATKRPHEQAASANTARLHGRAQASARILPIRADTTKHLCRCTQASVQTLPVYGRSLFLPPSPLAPSRPRGRSLLSPQTLEKKSVFGYQSPRFPRPRLMLEYKET
jgi:hypothetical protein